MAGYIGSKAVNLSTTGADINGNANIDGDLSFGDNDKAIFGAGSDLEIYHDGVHSRIVDAGTGNLSLQGNDLRIKNADASKTYISATNGGALDIRYNDNIKLTTTSTGIDVTGNATFADNGKAIFGAGSDLQIYHDGTNSFVKDAAAGDLILDTNGDSVRITHSANGETMARFQKNNKVELYYDNALKLATTATGVDVTGAITADALNVSAASPNIDVTDTGTSHASQDFLTNSNAVRATIGVERSAGGGLFVGSSPYAAVFGTASAGNTEFATNNNVRMTIDSSGNVGIGTSSPSYPLHVDRGATGDIAHFEGQGSVHLRIGENSNNMYINANNGNATLAFQTNSAERMRIDSSGNLLVGKTAADVTAVGIELLAEGIANFRRVDQAAIDVRRQGTAGDIALFRSDNSAFIKIGQSGNAGYIDGLSGDTGLKFEGAHIRPRDNGADIDNAVDLGNSSYRFDDVYATNGTINTSDRNEKQDIEVLSDAETRVAVAAKGLLRKFRWKDKVAEKGDEARTHFGIIAQDLQAAFAAEGLDAGDYAMFISSTWTDEETGEERTRMGVRYSELLAFIIGAL